MTSSNAEQWVAVVGFEGLYEVSDHGQVRSLGRIDTLGRRRQPMLMQGGTDGEGYNVLGLTPASIDGRPVPATSVRRHVIVLEAFRGPAPAGMEGCHGDGDPDHNMLSNLRWDTQDANRADRFRHGTALTSKKRPARRAVRPAGTCHRNHRLVAPNLTASSPGRPSPRCLACQRGHSNVKDARRRGIELNLRVEADRHYVSLMGALEPCAERAATTSG